MTTTRTLALNGIDLHVTEAGTGHPLLLLHGLTASADLHRESIEGLAAHHRVIAPDLRGHGRTTRPAAYTLADHVADVVALLDALELPSADVVGISMGSYIAQALATTAPERVDRLVLVVSKSNGLTTSSARYLAEHADEVADLSSEEQQMWLAQRMFAPETGHEVRDQVWGWFGNQVAAGLALTEEQVEAANRALAGFDLRPELPDLAAPTLVVSGRHDVLNPPEEGRRIADLVPGSRLEVFERSGHFLTGEEPERFLEVVEGFLAAEAA